MKEFTIEEKAKAYDEALSRASKLRVQNPFDTVSQMMEHLFPELRESEDERIRKTIIRFFKDQYSNETEMYDGSVTVGKAIAWLEKQGKLQYWKPSEEQLEALDYAYNSCSDTEIGNYYEGVLETLIDELHKLSEKQDEQKPADKVEPKFHEGDWIIDGQGIVRQIERVIENVTNHTFGYDLVGGDYFNEEYDVRLWTIQDAKDGDILTCYSDIKGQPIEQTGIIKQYVGRHGGCSNSFKVHFGVDWDNNVVIDGYMGSSNIYPATKEQRDTLFAKMKEAGYEWDAEKKELRKIEQNLASSENISKKAQGETSRQ